MQKPNIPGQQLAAFGKAQKSLKAQSNYNPEKLLELINSGKSAQEICKELNIKHLQVLKAHIMRLMSSKKIFLEVTGLFLKSSKQAYVNKNGEIRITKHADLSGIELVPNLTEFTVKVQGNTIILKKIGAVRAATEKKTEEDAAAVAVEPHD